MFIELVEHDDISVCMYVSARVRLSDDFLRSDILLATCAKLKKLPKKKIAYHSVGWMDSCFGGNLVSKFSR